MATPRVAVNFPECCSPQRTRDGERVTTMLTNYLPLRSGSDDGLPSVGESQSTGSWPDEDSR